MVIKYKTWKKSTFIVLFNFSMIGSKKNQNLGKKYFRGISAKLAHIGGTSSTFHFSHQCFYPCIICSCCLYGCIIQPQISFLPSVIPPSRFPFMPVLDEAIQKFFIVSFYNSRCFPRKYSLAFVFIFLMENSFFYFFFNFSCFRKSA